MRKISLLNYLTGDYETDAKQRITEILFNRDLKLTKQDLIDRNSLNIKIQNSINEALLEEAEYLKLKASFDLFKQFGYEDLELIDRIDNASIVEVAEKVT